MKEIGKITKLEVQKRHKDRVNLFIDGEFKTGLTLDSVVFYHLRVGNVLTEEQLDNILETSETTTAFTKAYDYLGRGLRTAKQMREYLVDKGYDPTVVERVMDKLRDYKYVDDEYYAKLYTDSNLKDKGKRRIASELIQKGVMREQIEQAISEIDDEALASSAETLAQKYMRSKEFTTENLAKLQRYLLSRGYDYDTISTVLHTFKEEL